MVTMVEEGLGVDNVGWGVEELGLGAVGDGVGVGVGFGVGEGVGVGRLLVVGGTTVVVTFLVVVTVVVPTLVMVDVAVPDFKMLLQKRRASAVWPSKASKPQSLTIHVVSKTRLRAVPIERTVRIAVLAFLKGSSICTCSKDCCENQGQLHVVDYVYVLRSAQIPNWGWTMFDRWDKSLLIRQLKSFHVGSVYCPGCGSSVHSFVRFIYN
jgi:hypothetical protein